MHSADSMIPPFRAPYPRCTPWECRYSTVLLMVCRTKLASRSEKNFCRRILSSSSPPRISSVTRYTCLPSSYTCRRPHHQDPPLNAKPGPLGQQLTRPGKNDMRWGHVSCSVSQWSWQGLRLSEPVLLGQEGAGTGPLIGTKALTECPSLNWRALGVQPDWWHQRSYLPHKHRKIGSQRNSSLRQVLESSALVLTPVSRTPTHIFQSNDVGVLPIPQKNLNLF